MKRFSALLTVCLLISALGCSQLKKREDVTSTTPPKTPIEEPGSPFEQLPPQLSNQSPKRIALILGGGGARTLAHAGVIRALLKEKIEISHVAGVEWSSLVAASFAISGQTHDMDWKLYKLDALDLKFGSGFFGLGGKKSIQDLSEYFSGNFGKANGENSKVNFSCASQTVGAASPRILERGNLADLLKQCIPYPPYFEIEKNVAANSGIWSLVRNLKKEDADIIVFVDVLSSNILSDPLIRKDKATTLLWTQVIEANQVAKSLIKNSFTISLDRYSIFDFSNRKSIEAAGEKAGSDIARKLKEQYSL